MANQTVGELRKKADSAWGNLTRQLDGMEPHVERSETPGDWTTRQVLVHLLFEPGSNPADFLKTFVDRDLPVVDLKVGEVYMTPERRAMTLEQLVGALDAQRRDVFRYLESVPEADLERRKVRIPMFKQFTGIDEISLAMFVGGMFDFHWQDHAGQLAKIRKAAGLPEASH